MITRRLKLSILLITAALATCLCPRAAKAGPFNDFQDRTVTVKYRIALTAAIASTDTVLIDLSDTTNWPHKDTGAINITSIRIDTDKVAASTASVRIGVVNFVDSSTGSVTWFTGKEGDLNASYVDESPFLNLTPCFYKCRVNNNGASVDGSTPYLFSNFKTSGSTIFQTDVVLPSLATSGSSAPGVGDIVAQIDKTSAAAATFNIEITYFSERR